ncbi:hypothetical protein UFOVP386_45 [uncultured Caudovirales phage]|uniref:Uncharacterized protein n=1 Tax=uncultured Caudovirales phage TaxID=2100421 RepID=A0A6J7X7A6_9CAUD|nr:hypothetical protein UFOVP386_45 [uncultured Caudovirales phage]
MKKHKIMNSFTLSKLEMNPSEEIEKKPISVLMTINEYVNLKMLLESLQNSDYPEVIQDIARWRRNGITESLSKTIVENHYYNHQTYFHEYETY